MLSAKPQCQNIQEKVVSKSTYAVYGASGYGKECMPLAQQQYGPNENYVYIDDKLAGHVIHSIPVLSYNDFLLLPEGKHCVIAIANSTARESLYKKLLHDGISLFSIQSIQSSLYSEADIGFGYILNPFSCITANIKIGQCFHANVHCYIAHDCVIGDYVTVAPGAVICGNVHIGDHAYIGASAVIKQGTPDKPLVIGKGAVVGMGAVVTKSVPPGQTVVGNPARPIERN